MHHQFSKEDKWTRAERMARSQREEQRESEAEVSGRIPACPAGESVVGGGRGGGGVWGGGASVYE